MNYYSHHMGDFDRATRHLTRVERSIYRDLIEVYYDTEKELTLDMAALCRKVIARTNEEATAVEQVLNEFFIKTPTGWFHSRCDEEIEAYHNSTTQKSAAGKASAAKREQKRQQALNGNSTPVEQTLNGTPTNQEPLTNIKDMSSAKPNDPCPQSEILSLYHEILPTYPAVRAWTPKRQAKLRARWKEDSSRQSLDWWREFFVYVSSSEFLMGRTEKPFSGSLEWLVTEGNFVKVIEGTYENRKVAA